MVTRTAFFSSLACMLVLASCASNGASTSLQPLQIVALERPQPAILLTDRAPDGPGESWQVTPTAPEASSTLTACNLLPGGRFVLTTDIIGAARLIDLETRDVIWTKTMLPSGEKSARRLSLSKDGQWFVIHASFREQEELQFFATADGRRLGSLLCETHVQVYGMNSDGENYGTRMALLEGGKPAAKEEPLVALLRGNGPLHYGQYEYLGIPGLKGLGYASIPPKYRLVLGKTRLPTDEIHKIPAHLIGDATHTIFHERFALINSGCGAMLLDLTRGVEREFKVQLDSGAARTYKLHGLVHRYGEFRSTAIALGNSGKLVASARQIGIGVSPDIELFDADTAELRATLTGHSGSVMDMAFTADGKRLISASLDGTTRLWDCESGQELAKLEGHAGGVRFVRLIRNDQYALTAGEDGTLRITRLP